MLDGNQAAANILAKVVHSEFSEEDSDVSKLLGSKFQELPDEGDDKDISDLGIWIDPIGKTTLQFFNPETQIFWFFDTS